MVASVTGYEGVCLDLHNSCSNEQFVFYQYQLTLFFLFHAQDGIT